MKRCIWTSILLTMAAGCAKSDEAAPAPTMEKEAAYPMDGEEAGAAGAAPFEPKRDRAPMAKKSAAPRGAMALGSLAADEPAADPDVAEGGGGEVAPSRSWFPETFLFEPLVKTNAQGQAKVSVEVPDRLTSWRVLALAHSREGAQAGAVTTFLGTLPTYVDPIVPPFLVAGDVVSIPIQVVNTTDQPVNVTLRLSASGAAVSEGSGDIALAAEASLVRYAELRANEPGVVKLVASLGKEDAVERTIPVLPTGRPRTIEKSGTLAAPRLLSIAMPRETDPRSAKVRLTVFPGALAILRSELDAGLNRGGIADDAYLLLLAGRAKGLLERLGGTADEAWLRKLRIIATQRAIRYARAPDPATAALLTEAALAHPESPVLSRLGERLAAQLASWQRPDGTFQGSNGWTLQRLLVTTADSVRAVRAANAEESGKRRAQSVALRANGAFERNLRRIEDPYTAAAVLASGAADASMSAMLIERVTKALVTRDDGSRVLPVPASVLRPDGAVPSEVEATALAALALADDPDSKSVLPDLGSSILSAYRPSVGFGDGYTNLIALRAVLEIFDQPLPEKVNVDLSIDGRSVASGELSGDRLKDVLTLNAPVSAPAGKHTVIVKANPPVPGLGFALVISYYRPWTMEAPAEGIELTVDLSKDASVGRPVDVTLTAVAPASMSLSIKHALPAGMQVDRPSLDALVANGVIQRYRIEDGAVSMEAPSRAQGQTFSAHYRVIPTLAGTLHTSASTIVASGRPESPYFVPPSTWQVKR